jgi:hypothetical protein
VWPKEPATLSVWNSQFTASLQHELYSSCFGVLFLDKYPTPSNMLKPAYMVVLYTVFLHAALGEVGTRRSAAYQNTTARELGLNSSVGAAWCSKDMGQLLSVAAADSRGKHPDGRCYSHVSHYLDLSGYGGIKKNGFDSAIPSTYWAEAHMFADYLNKGGNAQRLGMQNVQSSYANNPYTAPAGSIVVVRAGTPGTRNPTAGDIAVKGQGSNFWNGGAMGYGGTGNFPKSNNYVLGIYVPIKCSGGSSPSPAPGPPSAGCPKSCQQCVSSGGGKACKARCSSCSSSCISCIVSGGGTGCSQRCH